MKAWTLATIILAATMNLVTSCSGSGNSGCESICDHIIECSPEDDRQECLTMCGGMEQIFRNSAWSNATSCILGLPCGANFNPNTCLEEAANKESIDVIDDLATRVCTKYEACGDQTPVADCVAEAKQSGEVTIFVLFADSVLDCIATCVEGLDCPNVETGMDGCLQQCGVTMELDDE